MQLNLANSANPVYRRRLWQHRVGIAMSIFAMAIGISFLLWILAVLVINSFGAIRPIQAFNPLEGKWGALQLAGRYSQLDVDSDTFLFVDPTKSANQARAWTIGANWYLNANALIRTDYEQVSFDGGAVKGNRPTEQVFATRFQLAF